MKKYLSFVLIIIMLLFVACSKNSSSNPVSAGEQPATENIYIILGLSDNRGKRPIHECNFFLEW